MERMNSTTYQNSSTASPRRPSSMSSACSSSRWPTVDRSDDDDPEDDPLLSSQTKSIGLVHAAGASDPAGQAITCFEAEDETSDASFQRELLETHNTVRRKHGAHSLFWSSPLAELARDWAMKLLDKGRVLYLDLPDTGENIVLSKASELNHLPTGVEISNNWANEADKFDFAKPRWRTGCHHFTQMVWRESMEIGGCRCWDTSKNLVAIVVLYRPGGNSNLPGSFAANVFPDGTEVPPPIRNHPLNHSHSSSSHSQGAGGGPGNVVAGKPTSTQSTPQRKHKHYPHHYHQHSNYHHSPAHLSFTTGVTPHHSSTSCGIPSAHPQSENVSEPPHHPHRHPPQPPSSASSKTPSTSNLVQNNDSKATPAKTSIGSRISTLLTKK